MNDLVLMVSLHVFLHSYFEPWLDPTTSYKIILILIIEDLRLVDKRPMLELMII